nr:peptidoglycan synthetase [Bacteroidota bacterium]
LDPRPKFLHYKPQIALITGIAWDHINVFKTEEIYIDQFRQFLEVIEHGGDLVSCNTDELLKQVIAKGPYKIHKTEYGIPEFMVKDGIAYLLRNGNKIPLGIFGNHNLVNLNGAMTVCRKLGIEEEQFIEAIRTFTGAGKRLELLGENENTSVFKDFAHAPSKVRASVDAVKQRNPERDLVAILELHTYSSLSKHFLPHYREHKSLESADMPVVYFSQHAIKLKKLPPIEKEDIEAAFQIPGLRVFTDSDQLRDFILNQGWHNKNLLMMSSGNFGGIDLNEITEGICNK